MNISYLGTFCRPFDAFTTWAAEDLGRAELRWEMVLTGAQACD